MKLDDLLIKLISSMDILKKFKIDINNNKLGVSQEVVAA